MSSPAPEHVSPGLLAHVLVHVREWFAQDVAPDLAEARKVAGLVREAAPHLKTLADLAVTLAKADPGLSPEIVAGAEEAAEAVGQVAAALAGI